jgi:putative chitinase
LQAISKMIDKKSFFDSYRSTFGRLRPSQVEGIDDLLDAFNADPVRYPLAHVAYMLASVKHECADRWKPITEFGSPKYFLKYEFNTNLGRELGNLYPGDGSLYKGRGYSMITGRSNYFRFSRKLELPVGMDLISYPDKALEPKLAYRILTLGCTEGLFTGICLGKYLNDKQCDYVNARRVINGLDDAKLIAGYAAHFEKILKRSMEDS